MKLGIPPTKEEFQEWKAHRKRVALEHAAPRPEDDIERERLYRERWTAIFGNFGGWRRRPPIIFLRKKIAPNAAFGPPTSSYALVSALTFNPDFLEFNPWPKFLFSIPEGLEMRARGKMLFQSQQWQHRVMFGRMSNLDDILDPQDLAALGCVDYREMLHMEQSFRQFNVDMTHKPYVNRILELRKTLFWLSLRNDVDKKTWLITSDDDQLKWMASPLDRKLLCSPSRIGKWKPFPIVVLDLMNDAYSIDMMEDVFFHNALKLINLTSTKENMINLSVFPNITTSVNHVSKPSHLNFDFNIYRDQAQTSKN